MIGPGEDDEQDDDVLEWTDEDEDRYQARQEEEHRRRRTRRRQGVSFALLVLVVLGAGLVGAGINQGWWEWPFSRAEAEAPTDCDRPEPTIAAAADTKVNVLNATDIRGLAATISGELAVRGYVVEGVGNEDSGVDVVDAVQVRYGAATVAQAQSVALHFRGVVLVDDGRTGDVVDVVLGQAYTKMGGAEEAAAVIAAATPELPAGCSDDAARLPGTTAPSTT